MNMEAKRIKCPRCQGLLEVTNPKNQPALLITCPNPQCGAKIRLTFATGETQLAEQGANEKEIGRLVFQGWEFPLQEGVNTIGRHSQSCTSTIQLETNDLTMSRTHAQIEVKRLKSGRVKAILSDVRDIGKMEAVPMMLDDETLFPEDAIVLANGDVITMGHTKIKYVR